MTALRAVVSVAEGGRLGLSTGTCAAAAAKAAALALVGEICTAVTIDLPAGEQVTLAVESVDRISDRLARAAVIKDAGDDPDVTDGLTVVADVEYWPNGSAGRLEFNIGDEDSSLAIATAGAGAAEVELAAGPGVGTVTRAGLQIAVGEPAINPVPRQMIATAVRAVLPAGRLRVAVSIPGGEAVAQHTFNPRLGVVGGLSILGTSGRVIPKSEDAWLRSLLPQVDMALAAGRETLYVASGRFGERAARELYGADETAIVECANFVGDLFDYCVDTGVSHVVLIGHAGKLTKVAAGLWNTHSRYGDARLETVAALAAAAGAAPPLVAQLLDLPTVEAATEVLASAGLSDVWDDVADRVVRRGRERLMRRRADREAMRVDCAIVAYNGEVLGRSAALRSAPAVAGAERSAATRSGTADAWPAALTLTVVGTGPGSAEWLPPAAWRTLRVADVVVGGRRQLAAFAPPTAQRLVIGADMNELAAALRLQSGRRVVVLASGDPGFYGIAATLRRLLPAAEIITLPGISSVQLAAARLGRSWHDVHFASAHGSELAAVISAVRRYKSVFALTDGVNTPQALAAALADVDVDLALTVLERLGLADERITSGSPAAIANGTFAALAVVFIEHEEHA